MSLDALPDEFGDLLVELADADFVLVGGWAMAVHGHLFASRRAKPPGKPSAVLDDP